MNNLNPDSRVILIGGTSHVGKSAVSESLAAALGWDHLSTDSLARHPGRPWKPAHEKVPDHVAEHYLTLSVEELIEDVLRHYRVNVWPKVEEIIGTRLDDSSASGIVLEGSALWPEFATDLDFDKVAALWLAADEKVIRERIYAGSLYKSKSSRERMMIDKFLERTLAFNARMIATVKRQGFILVDILHSDVEDLTDRCLSVLDLVEQ